MKKSAFKFSSYKEPNLSPFEKLLEIFKELLTHTSGDFNEAIDWLRELDKEYKLTDEDYTIDDFINDLLEEGYIIEEIGSGEGKDLLKISSKMEKALRKFALKKIFGKIKKSGKGNHKTKYSGNNNYENGELKNYQFGDSVENILMTESLKNMQVRSGFGDFDLRGEDLVVQDSYQNAQMSTVLMIDISHSMILYGEDRITPAKKVAMALSELITTRYPKDSLDIIVFGNDAKVISIKNLPYLKVGPYHTNTVAGLKLAMDILRRRKNNNKQILMITDGEPTVHMEDGRAYFLMPRSSISKTPLRLANSIGLIDGGYRGEIMAPCDNIKDSNYTVEKGQRLFQLVASDCSSISYKIDNELSETSRGSGGFGSTGK